MMVGLLPDCSSGALFASHVSEAVLLSDHFASSVSLHSSSTLVYLPSPSLLGDLGAVCTQCLGHMQVCMESLGR